MRVLARPFLPPRTLASDRATVGFTANLALLKQKGIMLRVCLWPALVGRPDGGCVSGVVHPPTRIDLAKHNPLYVSTTMHIARWPRPRGLRCVAAWPLRCHCPGMPAAMAHKTPGASLVISASFRDLTLEPCRLSLKLSENNLFAKCLANSRKQS